MYPKIMLMLLFLFLCAHASENPAEFTYNGFQAAKLVLDGAAEYKSSGLLALTNSTPKSMGHAFYPDPIRFKISTTTFSFATTFVFAIVTDYPLTSHHGIAFAIAPTRGLPEGKEGGYLGLLNHTSNGNIANNIFAVELDTHMSDEFGDPDDNHVGIDINSLNSTKTETVGYYGADNRTLTKFNLTSGVAIQVWVDYIATSQTTNVTVAPVGVDKPPIPLLSLRYDLSPIVNEFMYVGFSSSRGRTSPTNHYLLGWSFKINGPAAELDTSQLPKVPHMEKPEKSQGFSAAREKSRFLKLDLPVILVVLVVAVATVGIVLWIRRKRKFAEVVEEWEKKYGPHRFKYKDLYTATRGFTNKQLLGRGGFGSVYKGTLRNSNVQIAVKRISHESRQGMKEFIAEIVSIGQMKHRNIVILLGYCRRKSELLLVYDYMPNGSLDKYLYDQPKVTLDWSQRFRIIKGVASGLFYLHEEWEQVVIHRDIKSANVLLDAEMNGRLGDFGLARLYDHGTLPQSTNVVGTRGYIAPELSRTGAVTTSSDIFAFGAFLLEVACGRKPIELQAQHPILVDWVYSCWRRGNIVEAQDTKLGSCYNLDEIELVLKLGLICSVADPSQRPTTRKILQYLDKDAPLPDMSSDELVAKGLVFSYSHGFDDVAMSYPSSSSNFISMTPSLLSGGR